MRHMFSDLRPFRRDPLEFIRARGCASTVPLERLRLGPRPAYLVVEPSLIKPILKSSAETIDKGTLIHQLRPVVGMSSLTISGPEHVARRAAIHTQLGRGAVERMVPALSSEIIRLMVSLARQPQFDAREMMSALSLRMICIALFGQQVLTPCDEAVLVNAVLSAEAELAADLFRVLPRSPWRAIARRRRIRHARHMMGGVVGRIRVRAGQSSVLRALEELGLSDDDIRDEILMLLITGHHTTGTAATYILYFLARYPEVAHAIAAEADQLCNAAGDIHASALKHGHQSLAFVREVLRLYPAAWWYSREVRQPTNIAGTPLPTGASLIIAPWHLHRDPRHWDDPEAFRLDRTYTTPAYVPFGAGPRACVGMGISMLELQLLSLHIAAAVEIQLLGGAVPVTPQASITLMPPAMPMAIRVRDSHLSTQWVA